ncbi:hypothetical protein [Flexivirga lutea]
MGNVVGNVVGNIAGNVVGNIAHAPPDAAGSSTADHRRRMIDGG